MRRCLPCPAWTVADLVYHLGRSTTSGVRWPGSSWRSRGGAAGPPVDRAWCPGRPGRRPSSGASWATPIRRLRLDLGAPEGHRFIVVRHGPRDGRAPLDARGGGGEPRPIDAELASDGIDEFLTFFVDDGPREGEEWAAPSTCMRPTRRGSGSCGGARRCPDRDREHAKGERCGAVRRAIRRAALAGGSGRPVGGPGRSGRRWSGWSPAPRWNDGPRSSCACRASARARRRRRRRGGAGRGASSGAAAIASAAVVVELRDAAAARSRSSSGPTGPVMRRLVVGAHGHDDERRSSRCSTTPKRPGLGQRRRRSAALLVLPPRPAPASRCSSRAHPGASPALAAWPRTVRPPFPNTSKSWSPPLARRRAEVQAQGRSTEDGLAGGHRGLGCGPEGGATSDDTARPTSRLSRRRNM